MNKKTYFDNTGLLILIYVCLATFSMTWIGYLQNTIQVKPLIQHISLILLYVAFCELWQIMLKFMYHKNKQFAWNIFYLKTIISYVLITILTFQTSFKVFLLLTIYEFYQFLLYRNSLHYIENIFYPLSTGLIKGLLFNILLSISQPYILNNQEIENLIIPIALFLIVGRIEQQLYQVVNKQETFNLTFIIYYLFFFIVLLLSVFTSYINLLQLIITLALTIGYFYLIKLDHLNILQQNTILMLYVALTILTVTF